MPKEQTIGIVTGHELGFTTQSGTPYIRIYFEYYEGEELKTRGWDGWLTDKCFMRTISTLRKSLGWTGKDLKELDGTDTLVGQKASLVVGEEEYDGQKRKKIQFVNQYKENAENNGEMESVMDRFKAKLAEYDAKHPRLESNSKQDQKQTQSTEIKEDDIPF